MIKNLYHLILAKEVWRKKASPRKSQDTNEPNTFFIVQMKWIVYEIKMINYDDDDDENLAEVGDNDDENDDDDDDDEQRRNKPVDRSCICWSVWRCIWIFFGRIWSSFTSYLSYAVSEVTPVTRLAICPSVCMGCTVSLMMIIFWNFLGRTCFSFLSSYSFTVSWVLRYIWIFPEDFGPVSLVTWVTQFRKLHQLQGWPSAQVCVWVAQFH